MMIEIYTLLIAYFMGILMGIIDEWNEKAMFFIFVIMIIYIVIAYIIFPIKSTSALTWWVIPNTIMCTIGMINGSKIYNNIFKK